MEKRKIEKDMLVDKCPECGQEITGYTHGQVNARMKFHKMKHIDDVKMQDDEGGGANVTD